MRSGPSRADDAPRSPQGLNGVFPAGASATLRISCLGRGDREGHQLYPGQVLTIRAAHPAASCAVTCTERGASGGPGATPRVRAFLRQEVKEQLGCVWTSVRRSAETMISRGPRGPRGRGPTRLPVDAQNGVNARAPEGGDFELIPQSDRLNPEVPAAAAFSLTV